MNTLLEKAFQYTSDIRLDVIPSNKYVKRQVERSINDYDIRQHEDDFAYYFDMDKCDQVNNLLKLFNYATGFLAGTNVLEGIADFQAFLLVNIFCWRFKDNKLKSRYREVVLYISRKCGKTWFVSLIFILLMLTEQNYSEFYSGCLNKDLASELRKAMQQTIEASPVINKHFKISKMWTGKIECKLTHSFFQPRVAEANKNNSIRPNAFCVDEFGAFDNKELYSAFKSGQRNIINPIAFITTTAYAKTDSAMNDELDYAKKVIDGTIENDRYFALLYYAEEENMWNDTGIYQACPLVIEENYKEIRETREKAKIIESEQEEYLTKSMNVMLESNEENKYISMEYWKKCCVDNINFEGKEVTVGVDLSVTTDLTAVAIMFKDGNNIYCMSHGFKPSIDTKNRREKINYNTMARNGYCNIHEGMTVNYTLVEEYIRSIEDKYNCKIKSIVTDPMNAKEMMERLAEDYDVILLKQTYTNLSPATKEFRKKVYDGEVFYKKNALLDWCMGNAITTVGKSDDEMLAKENKNKERIDMVAVLIFCYTQLIVEEPTFDVNKALDNCNWE